MDLIRISKEMGDIDSDLEEGEIIDDLPSTDIIHNKKRKLRDYVIPKNNSSIHKHKRHCKYAAHNKAKKYSRLKKNSTREKNKKWCHNPSYVNCKYAHSSFQPENYFDSSKIIPADRFHSGKDVSPYSNASAENISNLRKLYACNAVKFEHAISNSLLEVKNEIEDEKRRKISSAASAEMQSHEQSLSNPHSDSYKANMEIGNKIEHPVELNNDSDDEFRVDMLRAELIVKMYRKKDLQEQHLNQKPTDPIKECFVNNHKQNSNSCNPLHSPKVNSVNKEKNIVSSDTKLPASAEVHKQAKTLIITLHEESSDDSDTSEDNEAEILEYRQKSNVEIEEITSKAISCLSKAQQKEYFSLRKILAEKEKNPVKDVQQKKNELASQAISCLSKAQQEEYNLLKKILAEKEKNPIQDL